LAFYLFPALADLWDARDEYSSKLLIAVLILALGMLVLVPQQILLVLLLLIFLVSLQLAKIWDEYYSNAYRLENYLALSYFTGAVVGILFLILCGWAAKAGWFYFKGDFFNWLMGLILILLLSSLLPMLVLYYLRNNPLALRAQLCWQWLFLICLIFAFPYFAPQNLVDQFGFKLAPSNIEPVLAITQYQSGVFMLQRKQWNAIDIKIRKAYQVEFESPQLVLVKK
jgi:MFS family permease